MNKQLNCPKCNSVNFTYTGETEKCCKLCGTKWDDYGNVVYNQPMSRNDVYEAIIAEESQLESQTQNNSNMENTQETPNANSLRSKLDSIRSLIDQASQTLNNLENIIQEQKRKIEELESKSSSNVISRSFVQDIVDIVDGLASSQVEREFRDNYVSIQFGDYTDEIRLDNVMDAPSIYLDLDDVVRAIESDTDFRVI